MDKCPVRRTRAPYGSILAGVKAIKPGHHIVFKTYVHARSAQGMGRAAGLRLSIQREGDVIRLWRLEDEPCADPHDNTGDAGK